MSQNGQYPHLHWQRHRNRSGSTASTVSSPSSENSMTNRIDHQHHLPPSSLSPQPLLQPPPCSSRVRSHSSWNHKPPYRHLSFANIHSTNEQQHSNSSRLSIFNIFNHLNVPFTNSASNSYNNHPSFSSSPCDAILELDPDLEYSEPNSPTKVSPGSDLSGDNSQQQPPPPYQASTTSNGHIIAMLNDVRRKRELRFRRRSDITTYLDELILQEDMLHNESSWNRVMHKTYQFLNHPSQSSPLAIVYHLAVFIIVFVCLIATVCATIKKTKIQANAIKIVYLLEKLVIIWFTIEFIVRLWSSSSKKVYRGFAGKCRYLLSPSRIIDLLILILTTVVLMVNPSHTGHEVFVVSAFRGFHRFFQVAQVLTLKRSLKPWKILASVIYDQREQLFIILYTEFIVLCFLAYLAFLAERNSNVNFDSIADSMWWAVSVPIT